MKGWEHGGAGWGGRWGGKGGWGGVLGGGRGRRGGQPTPESVKSVKGATVIQRHYSQSKAL